MKVERIFGIFFLVFVIMRFFFEFEEIYRYSCFGDYLKKYGVVGKKVKY